MIKKFTEILRGVILRPETSDPSNAVSGALWYNSTGHEFKGQTSGTIDSLTMNTKSQTLTNKTMNIDLNTIVSSTSGRAMEINASGLVVPSSVTQTELGYISGVTGAIQTQINNHVNASTSVHGVTGSVVGTSDTQGLTNKTINIDLNTVSSNTSGRAAEINASGRVQASSVTTTELSYLSGTTGSVQTQLNDHISDTTTHGVTGNIVGTTDTQNIYNKTLEDSTIGLTTTINAKNVNFQIIDNIDLTKQAEFGTSNLDTGITTTFTFPQGSTTLVGHDRQQTLTQKTINIASNDITSATSGRVATMNASGKLDVSSVTITELGYVSGVTGAIQTQLNDHISDTTTHGVTGNIVGISDSQVLTNKTINLESNTLTSASSGQVIISNTSGKITPASSLSISLGGTGQTTANAGFNALSPMSAGGDLIYGGTSGAGTRLANGAAGQVLTSQGTTLAPTWSTPASAPDHSYDLQNLGIATSVGSNALTIALKQYDGSTDPSGGSPVKIAFRDTTLTSGAYTLVSATAATSLVISSGSTLGHSSAIEHFIYVYAINNAGTIELAASQSSNFDNSVTTTTAEGGAGAADSNNILYSTTARTSKAIRLIGRLTSTQTTAGTWAVVPTKIELPQTMSLDDVVSAIYTTTAGNSVVTSTTHYIDFGTKTKDTYNAVLGAGGGNKTVQGTGWRFVSPVDGYYTVNAAITFASFAWSGSQEISLGIAVNGTIVARIDDTWTGTYTNTHGTPPISATIYCTAGQLIEITVNQYSGSTLSLYTGGAYNYVSIVRNK